MKRLLCALLLAVSASTLIAAVGDDHVLAARDAAQRGDRARLAKQLAVVRGHDLEPYVEYWLLHLRLMEADVAEVRDFLARQSGTYLADKLRGEWLKVLGQRRQWEVFDVEFPPLVQADSEIACYALQNRLRLADTGALAEARPLWFTALELPESCVPLMEQLIADKRIDIDDVWERMRRLLEVKKLSAAKATAAYLPTNRAPTARKLDSIADKPVRHLALLPSGFAGSRVGREMALFALQRTARADPVQAALQWEKIKDKFPASDRGYAYGQLGWQGALRHLPEAIDWYALAGDAPLSEEQLAWKARAALRALNWEMVRTAIDQMPREMQARPEWFYWMGRARAALGDREVALAHFRRIAGQPNFYGNLADDELDQPITLPPSAKKPDPEEVKAIENLPGIRRALALFALDMRAEGIREWNWTIRGMDDGALLAAAEFAQRHEIFDRAINAADRTVAQHDYHLRYLAPFREHVEPRARALSLDAAWVYGLMRQESRFITNAKSVVGAKGLMQLMPKTASWVAKKIGLKDYRPARVAETDINVMLGTHYLRLVLDNLDSHPVLASAAYNAGPGRARKWRGAAPMEGAIYAETIPFTETRDYVKKVMSNSVYYAALFDGKPQSLRDRLGTIGARGGASDAVLISEDLP